MTFYFYKQQTTQSVDSENPVDCQFLGDDDFIKKEVILNLFQDLPLGLFVFFVVVFWLFTVQGLLSFFFFLLKF